MDCVIKCATAIPECNIDIQDKMKCRFTLDNIYDIRKEKPITAVAPGSVDTLYKVIKGDGPKFFHSSNGELYRFSTEDDCIKTKVAVQVYNMIEGVEEKVENERLQEENDMLQAIAAVGADEAIVDLAVAEEMVEEPTEEELANEVD